MEINMPTEKDANEAIAFFAAVMPTLSKEINGMSKKELRRYLISLLVHPIEDVPLTGEIEHKMFELMLSIINAKLLVLSYAGEVKRNELNKTGEQNVEVS